MTFPKLEENTHLWVTETQHDFIDVTIRGHIAHLWVTETQHDVIDVTIRGHITHLWVTKTQHDVIDVTIRGTSPTCGLQRPSMMLLKP
jgi:hypothetical protein